MMITDGGTIIRTPVKDVNTYSRAASGVIVMRLAENQKLAGFTKVAHEEPEESDEMPEAADQEGNKAPEATANESARPAETTPAENETEKEN